MLGFGRSAGARFWKGAQVLGLDAEVYTAAHLREASKRSLKTAAW